MGDKGTFVQPTVLLNPNIKSRVYTDEIFGPVISVRTFKTEEEALQLANDTTYGLGCEWMSFSFPRNTTNDRSLDIHIRHPSSIAGGVQDRSRCGGRQSSIQDISSNAVWWIQAKRPRSRIWV